MSDPRATRGSLVAALEFPLWLVAHGVDAESCTHAGFYNPACPTCRQCRFADECEWRNRCESAGDWSHRTPDEVIDAVDFAVDYVAVTASRRSHRTATCRCQCCRWLRSTRRLIGR